MLLGNGDGTLQTAVNYEAGVQPVWLAVGDFNNDAVPDLVVANYRSEDASVLFGNGDGTFRAPLNLDAGSHPQWVVAGDLNGDGISDFAVSDYLGATVAVVLSNGDGSFHARPSLLRGLATWASVAGDFNGDGLSDLAAANFNRDGNLDCLVADANVGVVILLGNGGGTFRPPRGFLVENHPGALGVADFNQDGFQDVVVTNLFSHSFSLLLGRGDGTFEPAQNHDTEQGSAAIAVGDFNGDAIPDVMVTRGQGGGDRHNSVLVFLGNGDGTFQPPNRFPGGIYNPFQLVMADLNGDGKQDLAIGNALANSLSVLLGDGDGRFEPALTFATGNQPNSIAIGDFNHDGKPDLATANIPTDSGTYSISVLINDTPQ